MKQDLEKRLRSMSVVEPSDNLRRRIFGEKAESRGLRGLLDFPVRLRWAAALALATGLAGYSLARVGQSAAPVVASPRINQIQVQIVDAPVTQHVFDFTETSQDFLPGELDVRVETLNGV